MSKLFDDTVVNRYRHIHMLTLARYEEAGWQAADKFVRLALAH